MDFKKITAPDGKVSYIPEDIDLIFPESDLPKELAHFLAYIPWDEKYLEYVPNEYKSFFETVLPHLHARTTDVHTAVCLPLLKKLIDETDEPVKQRLVYISLILHDSGWSKCSSKEIADSLSYTGLALSAAARAPKNKHAELGSQLAGQILKSFKFDPPLSAQDSDTIKQMVLYHDVTKQVIDKGVVTTELYLVSDSDRFWSYTHQNFWQDTVRKGVSADEYASNLARELDDYFYTEQGKKIALELLAERREEVARWAALH